MSRVRIEAVGMSRFGRREETLLELCREAIDNLSQYSDPADVEAVFLGTMNPEEFTSTSNLAAAICDVACLSPVPAVRVETASSTGAAVFHEAVRAVKSGEFERVLCIAAEKMTHLDTKRTTKILAEVLAPVERKYGATMPAIAAMIARRYMHEHGMSREILARVPVKNHSNGALNPFAHFQKQVDIEKVLGAKMVSDPLTIYDCAPISDGACCAILSVKSGDVESLGLGQATDTLAVTDRDSLTSFRSTRIAAKKAYESAGVQPSDIGVAEVHDAFSAFEVIDSEDLRLFKPGRGWKGLEKGETELNGSIPINPSGGLKARGHPVGASGLSQIVEIYWQLTNNANKRQVDAKKGICQSIGGLANNNFVTILGAVR